MRVASLASEFDASLCTKYHRRRDRQPLIVETARLFCIHALLVSSPGRVYSYSARQLPELPGVFAPRVNRLRGAPIVGVVLSRRQIQRRRQSRHFKLFSSSGTPVQSSPYYYTADARFNRRQPWAISRMNKLKLAAPQKATRFPTEAGMTHDAANAAGWDCRVTTAHAVHDPASSPSCLRARPLSRSGGT